MKKMALSYTLIIHMQSIRTEKTMSKNQLELTSIYIPVCSHMIVNKKKIVYINFKTTRLKKYICLIFSPTVNYINRYNLINL